MTDPFLFAIRADDMYEDGNAKDWIIYVNRPGTYKVGRPLCNRCHHSIDHHSRSKGRCFLDQAGCKCESVTYANGVSDD